MIKLFPYLIIIRPINAILTAFTVTIGFWLSHVEKPPITLVLLIVAAVCALGFGNVINDILDFEGDRINHPKRPLPAGNISKPQAIYLCWVLAILSLITSFIASNLHLIGTLIPIILLILYSFFLKGTPLIGNFLVSLLVAYPIIFGGIGSSHLHILVIPALCAFFLNLSREIVKDIQDKKGDFYTGLKTTAILPDKILIILLMINGIIYIPLSLAPFFLSHFHSVYLSICLLILIPLHLFWITCFFSKNRMNNTGKISYIIKIEMFCGLLSLVFDTLFVA